MGHVAEKQTAESLPEWVPKAAVHYLVHTETGEPIRALARQARVHASTVLRQVRRYESLREDPLVDAALRELAISVSAKHRTRTKDTAMTPSLPENPISAPPLDVAAFEQESQKVLQHMSEPGALLAIAEGMDMAVVVQQDEEGQSNRTAAVGRAIAQAMALKDWISCEDPEARIARYKITGLGKSQLRSFGPVGFAEGAARFEGAEAVAPTRSRGVGTDNPVAAVARRRDRNGDPFLSREMLQAAERLKEDFELAQSDSRVPDWNRYMTLGFEDTTSGSAFTPEEAEQRVGSALAALGPGLGDVALRCCCFLEGMETIEKRFGWSARSGKIVLRIALQQLLRHYESQGSIHTMLG